MAESEYAYEQKLRTFWANHPGKTEADFLKHEIEKLEERLKDLQEKAAEKKKEIKAALEERYSDPKLIAEQLDLRAKIERNKIIASATKSLISNYRLRLSRLPHMKHTKQKEATFEGKKLNLSERFTIADRTVDLWKRIDQLKMADLKKYELLAVILGCNPDNARKLVSGKYDAHDRPELISDFLNKIKIESGQ